MTSMILDFLPFGERRDSSTGVLPRICCGRLVVDYQANSLKAVVRTGERRKARDLWLVEATGVSVTVQTPDNGPGPPNVI